MLTEVLCAARHNPCAVLAQQRVGSPSREYLTWFDHGMLCYS